MATNSSQILGSSLPIEVRNDFYDFSKNAVEKLASDFSSDPRYQILAGSYFSKVGDSNLSDMYLSKAAELIPGKQLVYFEWGSTLLNQNDTQGALEKFKKAYELEPDYQDAQILYLLGAIYANDRGVEQMLLSKIPNEKLVFDDRVLSAYYNSNRKTDAIEILQKRIELDPANKTKYEDYIKQVEAK
jgi:tetratricopeptide (TPR) repeat protein